MTCTTVRPSTREGWIGFCMGGRYTVLVAVSSDHPDAAWQHSVSFLSHQRQEG